MECSGTIIVTDDGTEICDIGLVPLPKLVSETSTPQELPHTGPEPLVGMASVLLVVGAVLVRLASR